MCNIFRVNDAIELGNLKSIEEEDEWKEHGNEHGDDDDDDDNF